MASVICLLNPRARPERCGARPRPSVRRALFALLIALGAVFAAAGAAEASGKVRHCSRVAEGEIKTARGYLRSNINEILRRSRDLRLSKRERRLIKRKLGKRTRLRERGVAIRCADSDRWRDRFCSHAWGVERALFRRRIIICYANMKRTGGTFCDLVDTILHEIGHSAGLPTQRNHNTATITPGGVGMDPVWRLGLNAGALCREQGADRPLA